MFHCILLFLSLIAPFSSQLLVLVQVGALSTVHNVHLLVGVVNQVPNKTGMNKVAN